MKNILVPTDFSETANAAAEVAATIAKKTNSTIYLLHVVNLLEFGDEDEVAKKLFVMKLVKKKMDALIAQPFFEGVNVVVALQFELIYEQIWKHAKQHNIDLIVMGTHGINGISDMFLGSNTQKVVRMAECPVITVKGKPENFDFKNIVFASDFGKEAEKIYWKIAELIKAYDSKIHLVRVCSPSDFELTDIAIERMETFAKKLHLKNYTVTIYNANQIESGIIKFSNSVKAGLAAIGAHGRTGWDMLIIGSKAENVVNHSNIPILSVQIPRD
jgi:nucleotide-binding universal stress UspA family protein